MADFMSVPGEARSLQTVLWWEAEICHKQVVIMQAVALKALVWSLGTMLVASRCVWDENRHPERNWESTEDRVSGERQVDGEPTSWDSGRMAPLTTHTALTHTITHVCKHPHTHIHRGSHRSRITSSKIGISSCPTKNKGPCSHGSPHLH